MYIENSLASLRAVALAGNRITVKTTEDRFKSPDPYAKETLVVWRLGCCRPHNESRYRL
jgi:hypothetical protein